MSILRNHAPFGLLLALFTAAVIIQQAVLPPMEGGDEYLHFNYVQFLASENRLPDRTTYASNSTRQQSGQPPLVYAAGALLIRLFDQPRTDGVALLDRYEALKNPWYAPPDAWNRTDNRNLHFWGAGDQSFATPDMARADRIMRLAAVGFGWLAVIGAYGAAGEVFCRRSWALTATAIFAFTPQMIHISTFVNTDIGVTAFTTLAIWQTLRLLRRGATPARLLLIGGLMGLAALAKMNALLALPAVGSALLIDAYKSASHSGDSRIAPTNAAFPVWLKLIIQGFWVGVPFALLFAPWVLYGWTTFNDPLGTRTHLRPGYFFDTPLTLAQVFPLLPEIYLSYWGKLASAVYLHPVTYTALGTLPTLAVIGAAVARRPLFRSRLAAEQAIVLGVLAVFCLVGLLHWLQTIQFITGRLIYPAHIVTALGITAGLRLLAERMPALVVRAYSVGVIVAAGALLGTVSLYAAYAPPRMRDQLPPLQGTPYDFENTIRFLGYSAESSVLAGDTYRLTLCWEVLKAADRPAAFSIKIVRDGAIIADRTSTHGMGRYFSPLWQAGDRFCDVVDVPIQTAPQPGQTYDLLLVLLDARTQAVDWQATALDGAPVQFPFIGQVHFL